MREMFTNDLEGLIANGLVSEIDIVSISYAGVDELSTTLRCMVIGDEPFRWMSFQLKRYMYPGVYPYYHTLNDEQNDVVYDFHDRVKDLAKYCLWNGIYHHYKSLEVHQ